MCVTVSNDTPPFGTFFRVGIGATLSFKFKEDFEDFEDFKDFVEHDSCVPWYTVSDACIVTESRFVDLDLDLDFDLDLHLEESKGIFDKMKS